MSTDNVFRALATHGQDPFVEFDINRNSLPFLISIIDAARADNHHETAQLIAENVADRRQLALFVDALFRYAEAGCVQLRMFLDRPQEGTWGTPWIRLPIGGFDRLIDEAMRLACRAALAADRVVFAPPVVTFKNGDRATEADVAEGVALSVECDKAPDQARQDLEWVLGPPTIVVKSGGVWTDELSGKVQDRCHLHWRLQEPTRTPEDHLKLKECRRLACLIAGGDGSAVPLCHPLRWPGSWHRKGEARLAHITEIDVNAEIDIGDALERLRERARAPIATSQSVVQLPKLAAELRAVDSLDVLAAVALIPNGNLEWDVWNKVGMAIWAATDGSAVGLGAWHDFSQRSQKYDEAETTTRWQHYRTSPPDRIGAGTLFHMAEQACPGWQRPSTEARKARRHTWIEAVPAEADSIDEGANQIEPESFIDSPLPRYRLSRGGLFYCAEEAEKPVWLSPPFEIVARTLDADGNWGKLLVWRDHDDNEIKWIMPARLLGGHRDELWQALYERGLEIAPGTKERTLLLAYLVRLDPAGRANVVSRVGWHKNRGFVFPDTVFGETGGTQIIYSGNTTASAYRASGTLEEWRERIGRVCVGNSRLVFAVSVAYAAPLLHVVGEESGGFHLKGSSRLGKTTAERVAGSVCGGGHGQNGYLTSYRATSNGLEGVCEDHCDMLLCLDEMGQINPQEAGDIIYMIANQGGKQRAARDGSARRAKQWRILFLSTGEISLADKMTEIGKRPRAGQEVRLVDIPADAGAGFGIFEDLHGATSSGDFAEQLKRATLECYGTPIRAYLRSLTVAYAADPATVSEMFRRFRDDFITDHLPADASGQVRSVCGRFGLVAAAGEFATLLGLTGWPEGHATSAAVTCLRAWLDQRGTTGDHDIEAGIRQVIAYVEAYGASRFEELHAEYESTVVNRVGFRRFYRDTREWEYFVLPEQWRNELAKGYDAAELAKAMVERGLMIAQSGKTSAAVRLGRHGKMRVYRLAPNIISGPQEDEKVDWIARLMSDETAVMPRRRSTHRVEQIMKKVNGFFEPPENDDCHDEWVEIPN